MKKSKRTLITLLAAACTFVPASATYVNAAKVPESGVVTPHYIAIVETSTLLEKYSGQLSSSGFMKVTSAYKCGITVELQQSNGSWTTIKKWTSSGNAMCGVDELYSPAKNYNYRLKITFNAYNSNGSLIESVVDYSDIVYYN